MDDVVFLHENIEETNSVREIMQVLSIEVREVAEVELSSISCPSFVSTVYRGLNSRGLRSVVNLKVQITTKVKGIDFD